MAVPLLNFAPVQYNDTDQEYSAGVPDPLMLLWEVRQSLSEAELSALDNACRLWRTSPNGHLAVRLLETQARATMAQWRALLDDLNAEQDPPGLAALETWAVRNRCLHALRCSLKAALESLPAGDREQVEDVLLTLRRGTTRTRLQIERLLIDDRIPRNDWADFFALLLTAEPAERIPRIREWSREHILEGDPAIGSNSLGRAVDIDEFASHLMSQPNQTYATAQRRLRDLSHAARWTIARDRAARAKTPLGKHVIWATFSMNQGGDPFDDTSYRSGGAAAVRASLGLEPGEPSLSQRSRKPSIFLIRYNCPPHIQRVPTTTDAGAGESWNYYFHPAPLGEPFGLTRAWGINSDIEQFKPEVVHEPVPLACITQPIERVR